MHPMSVRLHLATQFERHGERLLLTRGLTMQSAVFELQTTEDRLQVAES
ncbi:MAG TPA: hypothetical protein VII52_06715 [Gemmatimonadaceae bacterium]